MKRMKVWLMLDSQNFGGIESHVEQLALGLHHAKMDVMVVFLKQYGEHPIQQRLNDARIPWMALQGRSLFLLHTLQTQRPDVIHTHGYKAGILVRPLCRLLQIRCVSTFHSGEKKKGKLWFYDGLDRYSAFLAHQVFAVSPSILKQLPCAAVMAHNFVNRHRILPTEGDEIAFVGRLSVEKAPDRFIQLATHFPHLTFHLYGDGPMRDTLEETAPQNVVFHGMATDMTHVWPRVGLLVMPSRAEGLPMASLEAMAHGIPVAACQVGALDQLIQHNDNGWLVEQDGFEGLYEAIHTWVHSSPSQRQYWRQQAIQTIQQRYSAQVHIPRLLEVYSQRSGAQGSGSQYANVTQPESMPSPTMHDGRDGQ